MYNHDLYTFYNTIQSEDEYLSCRLKWHPLSLVGRTHSRFGCNNTLKFYYLQIMQQLFYNILHLVNAIHWNTIILKRIKMYSRHVFSCEKRGLTVPEAGIGEILSIRLHSKHCIFPCRQATVWSVLNIFTMIGVILLFCFH